MARSSMKPTLVDLNTRKGLSAVASVRLRFLEDRSTDLSAVRSVIARSWHRSAAAGVDPAAQGFEMLEDAHIDEQTLRCADPILRELRRLAADAGGGVVLVAPNCAVAAVTSDLEDRFPLCAGMLEDVCGTNSDGTALEEGHSVQVWSREHFREDLQDMCATSVIVRDPFRHGIRAVVCLALPERVALGSDARSIALIMEGVAAKITQALAARLSVREQALLAEYLRTVRQGGGRAVVATDGRTTIASSSAMELLDRSDHAVLNGYAGEVLESDAGSVEREIVLSGGRAVRVRVCKATDGFESVGTIVCLRPTLGSATARKAFTSPAEVVPSARLDAAGKADAFAGLVGESSVLQRALELARIAVHRRAPVHVVGEPGVGKHALAKRIASAVSTDVLGVDCARLEEGDEALMSSVRLALDSGSAVVVRRVDTLRAASAEALADLLCAYDRPLVVVTLRWLTGATLEIVSALRSTEIAMPALRLRREDIPALVGHFIAGSADDREFYPSARLLGVLTKADWPGNVRQLKEVIDEAVTVARGEALGVEDLPSSYHRAMARGSLSRLEEAELHELRQALVEANGNRTLAASILQIGRSTLYRRIDSYCRRGFDITT